MSFNDPKEKIDTLISQAENNLTEVRRLVENLDCTVDDDTSGGNTGYGDSSELILGVNMGKEYDQAKGQHPIIDYVQHLRVFLLLEDVYKGKFPSVNAPDYNINDLDSFDYSMTGYRYRLRQMKEQGFDVRISIESIFEKDAAGNVLRSRGFPNKSFSRAEWGGNETNIKANARQLAIAIHHCYEPYISRLEFGNEAWGEPGTEAMKWIIRGMIDGFQEVNSSIKLSLGGYQAYKRDNRWTCNSCNYATGDYIGNIMEDWMLPFVDEITIHPYSFQLNTINLTEAPLNNPNSEFKYLYDMVDWRNDNYPNLKLSITEIGWNSDQVGEQLQATYINQVIQEAKRLKLHAVYLYEAVDSPSDPVFSSCGMYTTNSAARKTIRAKTFLTTLPVPATTT